MGSSRAPRSIPFETGGPLQAAGAPLGFANPAIYALALSDPGDYTDVLHVNEAQVRNDFVNGGLQPDGPDLRAWLAFGPGHLYFLFLVAQLYLLLLIMPRSRRGLVAFTSVALAVQVALGVLHTYGPPAPGVWAWPLTYLPQMEAPFWAGYFCLGCLVGAEYERLRSRSHLWPIGLALRW